VKTGALIHYLDVGGVPALEASVARWLLHHTVPASFRAMRNPLNTAAGSPDVSAGHEVYRSKCELCHAYDGSGKTEIGSGQYPRPPDLRSADVQRMSDGELFYHIKNGIRHTGTPARELPDRKLWQVGAWGRRVRVGSARARGVRPARARGVRPV